MYVYGPTYGNSPYRPYLFGINITFLTYPCIYDLMQLKKSGIQAYLSDKWNYIDLMHIWGGFLNIFLHLFYEYEELKRVK